MLQLAYSNTKSFCFPIQRRKKHLFGAKGCAKKYPPNADHLNEGTCKGLWKEAKKVFMNRPLAITHMKEYVEKFKQTEQIHVENPDSQAGPDIYYRPKVYKSKGWCEVAGVTKTAKTWGICSPSCNYFVSVIIPQVTYYLLK